MFDVGERAGREFLEEMAARVDVSELAGLRGTGGFGPPNDFNVDRIIALLRERRFPKEDHGEYQWALYECGYEMLSWLSPWVRVYLGALYLYCNKQHAWALNLESDYCFMLIKDELEVGVSDCSKEMLRFIEWLDDWVTPGYEGYENYYPLLCWSMLRELRGDADQAVFDEVMRVLEGTDWEELELTDSERGVESWLDLRRRVPFRYGYEMSRFEWIIRGGGSLEQ